MAKIKKIQRSDSWEETLALTHSKLETVGVSARSSNNEVEVFIDGRLTVKHIKINTTDSENVAATIQEAMNHAIEGATALRKAEFEGRLSTEAQREHWRIVEQFLV